MYRESYLKVQVQILLCLMIRAFESFSSLTSIGQSVMYVIVRVDNNNFMLAVNFSYYLYKNFSFRCDSVIRKERRESVLQERVR